MTEPYHFLTQQDKILLKKEGKSIFFMSYFSEKENIVTRYIEGNENSFFLPRELPLEEWYKGRIFAESWDNHAPWFLGEHGILGANHGSFFTFRVTTLRHWLFEEDIGKCLTDEEGNSFILLSIENLSSFYIHSDIPVKGKTFCDHVTGSLFLEGKKILPEKVTRWMMNPPPGGQIAPHQRYNTFSLLADGKKELKEGEAALCSYGKLFVDMDLIFPDALLQYLKTRPGKYLPPNAEELPGTIKCEMTTFFQPYSCRRIKNKVTFLEDIPESLQYGMIQYYSEETFPWHEKLVPGLKKAEKNGMDIDLATFWSVPSGKTDYSIKYKKKDALSGEKLPNIFIDIFGGSSHDPHGIVLGYSSTCGITARGREKERSDTLLYLYRSGKIYPYAFEKDSAKKGESFTLHAFHQYFPLQEKKVCIFQHQEEDGYFLYVVFPEKGSSCSLSSAQYPAGKEFSILEADDGITFEKTGSGTLIFHAEKPGYILLKSK